MKKLKLTEPTEIDPNGFHVTITAGTIVIGSPATLLPPVDNEVVFQALRACIVYARDRRGNAFDFDEWTRMCDHAFGLGDVPPHALEEAQHEVMTLRKALAQSGIDRQKAERELAAHLAQVPKDEDMARYGLLHHARQWLLWPTDAADGPVFGPDVMRARLFAKTDAAVRFLKVHNLMHPEAPNSHERAGYTILRLR